MTFTFKRPKKPANKTRYSLYQDRIGEEDCESLDDAKGQVIDIITSELCIYVYENGEDEEPTAYKVDASSIKFKKEE